MRILDVTLDLREAMPVWPGDPPVRVERLASIQSGGDANVTAVACCVHTGTHVDAPVHFVDGGTTVENLDLETMIGTAVVVDVGDAPVVTPEVLESFKLDAWVRRLLIKSSNSDLWATTGAFEPDFVALSEDAAEWVVARGIDLVGIDYLSIQRYADGPETHRVLLRADVVIVEGLNLSRVEPGTYCLLCLPMRIAGSDGAPARVLLLEEGAISAQDGGGK